MVVNHLVGCTRLLCSGVVPDTEEHKLLLMPLLWVCQNVRTIAAAHFYRVNTVKLYNNSFDQRSTQYSSSRRLQKFYRFSHRLAREVEISLDKSSVFSGQALEILSRAPFDSDGFQEARKLRLRFYLPHWQKKEWHDRYAKLENKRSRFDTESEYNDWRNKKEQELEEQQLKKAPAVTFNINALVRRIKQMAPLLREVEVECKRFGMEGATEARFFETLLVQLLRLTPRIVLRTPRDNDPVNLLVRGISNLVHIDIELDGIELIAQLARRNAATLQTLSIKTRGHGLASEFVKNADGDYVSYPRLSVLKLELYPEFERHECPALPSAVPFPNLRLLRLNGYYPFGDDVLFRGNAATLESLVLKTLRQHIAKLVDSRIFTPTSHPKLQYVKIAYTDRYRFGSLESYTEYLLVLLSIAPGAAVRSFPGCISPPDLSFEILLFADYPNIQVLDLPDVLLEIWDAITLIKTLPLLSDLHSRMPMVIPPLPGLLMHELPKYLIATYAPMGLRFRCWHLSVCSTIVSEAVMRVLLLALICPNFDYCAVPKKQFKEHMDELEKALNLIRFKDHAPRLRRLLFTK
ncbi:hypothetical protein GGH94_004371 [Coemansia aciculifera]|uniref:Uncharacterized protein n=1 Tax=Coemansia aciculifera TaxID=417176 RepID=A0A9W8M5B6_9FUNG|nr:hypothetical protein GGH94_004371 [Coemansia aciculifera]KAJ2873213.1 hypothetical protein GGH93_003400 [Coemansia aciculifera]